MGIVWQDNLSSDHFGRTRVRANHKYRYCIVAVTQQLNGGISHTYTITVTRCERHGVANHRQLDCLTVCSGKQETSKLRIISPLSWVTRFPWQRARNAMLTHWGRDKMDAISQTTFWNVFSWIKIYEFRLRFHWNLFLRFKSTIIPHWFR